MRNIQLVNEWGNVIVSTGTTRPAATGFGATITPTQNTTGGAYAQLIAGASVTEDVYGIDININTAAVSGAARDALATLGLDPAGGTSYTDVCDLLCSQASTYVTGSGVWYYFPLWIKAGTSIGMRGSVNSVDLTAFNAFCRLYCRPTRPELIWCGQRIEQLGVTAASSTGTSVTMGTTSEGAWTSIGSPTRQIRYTEWGFGCNDAGMNLSVAHVDIGAGSTQKIIARDRLVIFDTSERVSKIPGVPIWANVKAGEGMHVRMQCSGAVETVSAALYVMGD